MIFKCSLTMCKFDRRRPFDCYVYASARVPPYRRSVLPEKKNVSCNATTTTLVCRGWLDPEHFPVETPPIARLYKRINRRGEEQDYANSAVKCTPRAHGAAADQPITVSRKRGEVGYRGGPQNGAEDDNIRPFGHFAHKCVFAARPGFDNMTNSPKQLLLTSLLRENYHPNLNFPGNRG